MDNPGIVPAGLTVSTARPVLLDVGNDGLLEIFVAQGASTGVFAAFPRLFLRRVNAGSPFIATSVPGGSPPGNPGTVVTGDVNGDGREDIVVGTQGATGAEEVFLNSGTNNFTAAFVLTRSSIAGALALADVDGDGDDDLVRSTPTGLEAWSLAPNGTLTVPLFTEPSLAEESPVFRADLDGDGFDDLVTERYGRGRVAFNDGGTALRAEALDGPRVGFRRIPTDLDGDGDVDLLVAPSGLGGLAGAGWRVASNDGRGTFALGPALPPVFGAGELALFDMDNDGDQDVYRAGSAAGTDDVFRNDGGGVFVNVTTGPASPGVTRIVPADLNGDGFLDVVLERALTPLAGLPHLAALNVGGTGFGAPFVIDPTVSRELDIVDVDGDGDLDVVAAGAFFGARLIDNNGAAGFAGTPIAGILSGGFRVMAGDLDGDGDPDLVLGGFAWLNDGTAAFPISNPLPPFTEPHLLADTDLDGDLDLVGRSSSLGGFHLENDGAALFGPPSVLDYAGIIRGVAPSGDVDGDGDLDLLRPDGRWLMNHLRQLSAGGVPRPGVPLVLAASASPGEAYQLWAAPTLRAVPLPLPEGMLWLDAATALLVTPGVIAPAGRSDVVIPVPNAPGIAGVSLHWQVFLTGQAELTSAVTTTF